MTIPKNSRITRHGLIGALALAGLTGCGSVGSMLEPGKMDYKSAAKSKTPSLEVPPDLTQLQRENRYSIPDAGKGTATASDFARQGAKPAAPSAASATAEVAPATAADMRIERAGNQRWLVVKKAPEALWPQIKDFWQESGFLINVETPQTGVIETDWAENRAKIPQDIIRSTIGKALDALYSTGERDKFRTRLERTADGGTEVYISHRGMQEVLVGREKESTTWTPRPADPELEAEFLARLMAYLGAETTQAKASVVKVEAPAARARLMKDGGAAHVEVDEGFDRAWRRVGLALDRVGFTVEDRDRAQGVYFVRYVDPEIDKKKASEKGFFSKLFSSSSNDKAKSAMRYRVTVKGVGSASQVSVQDKDGGADSSPTAGKILSLLNEQLK